MIACKKTERFDGMRLLTSRYGPIMIERALSSNWLKVSVARTVKLYNVLAGAVGVPEITPVVGSMSNGGGNVPAFIVHVSAPVPPVAITCWL